MSFSKNQSLTYAIEQITFPLSLQLGLLGICFLSSAHLAASPTFLLQWGTEGSEPGQFRQPYAITIDNSNTLYITDKLNHRVQKFDSQGQFLNQWGTEGSAAGQLQQPYGIVIDKNQHLYIADKFNHRIQKWDDQGQFLTQFGSYGQGPGQLHNPAHLALDQFGNLYVADKFNHRIQKWTAKGEFITQWGEFGNAIGQFQFTDGLAVDTQNHIYATTALSNRIQKFDPTGTFLLASWGTYGQQAGQFDYPIALAIDAQNRVYVLDTHNHRVQIFDQEGNFISQFGSQGQDEGQFSYPVGIALDPQGQIYIADTQNHRIQKFTDLEGTILVPPEPLPVEEPPAEPEPQQPPPVPPIVWPTGNYDSLTGLITGPYNGNGITLYNEIVVDKQASATNVVISGHLKNQGWLANAVITSTGMVEGGILSGYIENHGLMQDFEFKGAILEGGKLAGTVLNTSQVGGHFANIELAEQAHLIGGRVAGYIQGSSQGPALLENLKITANSQLSHVILGQAVTLNLPLTFGAGVYMEAAQCQTLGGQVDAQQSLTVDTDQIVVSCLYPPDLTGPLPNSCSPNSLENCTEIETCQAAGGTFEHDHCVSPKICEPEQWEVCESAPACQAIGGIWELDFCQVPQALLTFPDLGLGVAMDAKNQTLLTQTHFAGGGLTLTETEDFQTPIKVKLTDSVNIRGRITVDNQQVGELAEIFVYALVYPVGDTLPIVVMVDEKGQIQPWNEVLNELASFQSSVQLPAIYEFDLYEGQFLIPGRLEIYFGYGLSDLWVTNSSPIEVLIEE